MKKQRDKDDILVSRIMEDFIPEDVPIGFSERIMQQVRVTESRVPSYKPLISRKGWIGIGVFILAIVTLALTGNGTSGQEPGLFAAFLAEKGIQLPGIQTKRFYNWLSLDDTRSFWIFISITSFVSLTVIERLINNLKKPNDYHR